MGLINDIYNIDFLSMCSPVGSQWLSPVFSILICRCPWMFVQSFTFPWVTFSYKICSSPWIVIHVVSDFQLFPPTCPHFQVKILFGILIKILSFFFSCNDVINFFPCQKPIMDSYPWFRKPTSFCPMSSMLLVLCFPYSPFCFDVSTFN